jgi:DNA-binding transcriptional ArsR family regulator
MPESFLLELPERFFGALAHPLRLRILDFLDRVESPQSVTQIIAASESARQAAVSQQLRVLRDEGLVRAERCGTSIFYSIQHPAVPPMLACLRRWEIIS